MAMPTYDKTWIFKPNIPLTGRGNSTLTQQQLLYEIKVALTTASGWLDRDGAAAVNAHPWIVAASSNASVADLSDNWNSLSDVVAGTNFSWIVLRQPSINPNFSICFSTFWGAAGNNSFGVFSFSPVDGYTLTGIGTTTTPTATDIYTVAAQGGNTNIVNGYSLTYSYVLHVMMSTDGECTRAFLVENTNFVTHMWLMDKPKNPIPEWVNPTLVCVSPMVYGTASGSTSVQGVDYAHLNDGSYFRTRVGSANLSMYGSTEGYGSAMLGQNVTAMNDISLKWPLTPVGLVSDTTLSRGWLGSVYDMYFTSTWTSVGDYYPESGDYQFVTLPNIAVPWLKALDLVGV
jgi:hypothetical protein